MDAGKNYHNIFSLSKRDFVVLIRQSIPRVGLERVIEQRVSDYIKRWSSTYLPMDVVHHALKDSAVDIEKLYSKIYRRILL